MLIVWLVPVKGYAIDVPLGFQLQAYRVGIMVVVFAWISAAFLGLAPRPSGLGRRGVLIALLGIGAISIAVNTGPISRMGLDTSSQKALFDFAGFVFVFVMVGSMLKAERDIRAVAQVLVLGGSVVAFLALYEFYTGFNAFHHLNSALPGFTYSGSTQEKVRSGLIRVRGSAQHPIALAGALASVYPAGRVPRCHGVLSQTTTRMDSPRPAAVRSRRCDRVTHVRHHPDRDVRGRSRGLGPATHAHPLAAGGGRLGGPRGRRPGNRARIL